MSVFNVYQQAHRKATPEERQELRLRKECVLAKTARTVTGIGTHKSQLAMEARGIMLQIERAEAKARHTERNACELCMDGDNRGLVLQSVDATGKIWRAFDLEEARKAGNAPKIAGQVMTCANCRGVQIREESRKAPAVAEEQEASEAADDTVRYTVQWSTDGSTWATPVCGGKYTDLGRKGALVIAERYTAKHRRETRVVSERSGKVAKRFRI